MLNPGHWVVTDPQGRISIASPEIAAVLRKSAYALMGRSIYAFLESDRSDAMCHAAAAVAEPVTFAARLRPRDRPGVDVQVSIRADGGSVPDLVWMFSRAEWPLER